MEEFYDTRDILYLDY